MEKAEKPQGMGIAASPIRYNMSGRFRKNTSSILHIIMLNFIDLIYSKIFYTPTYTPDFSGCCRAALRVLRQEV
jgi:hypothetical protein